MTASPIASLQMYWMPEVADDVDAWWRGLREHLVRQGIGDAPEKLSFPDDIHSVWHDPGLVLSQTCGGPLITELGDMVRVVGTPSYDTPLTDGIKYQSAVIVRRDDPARSLADLRGRRAAVNGRESFSGYHALRGALADVVEPGETFFSGVVVSGAHQLSLRAVAAGTADCAAIDAVCFAAFEKVRPEQHAAVRVLATTPAVPGLPYITRGDASDEELEMLRRGVEAAFADEALADVRRRLMLGDFQRTDAADYAPIARTIEKGLNVVL
ncbi:MAG: PhnD/SsuA/transferrin family substrate-binding protein [Rhodospirillales bacterium]